MINHVRVRQIAEMIVAVSLPEAGEPTDLIASIYRRWPDVSFVEVERGLELAAEQISVRARAVTLH